ncbi:MAG: CoB--CoM heterodisulfide reductase iron-sulfur subunit B family protein [Syntrophomonas sp.]|nr:CoB--CoM heterodisulfide reductase iron-sulfur subunit B family protein [Syntrophomonas sp.]
MKLAYYPGCSLDGSGLEYGLSTRRTAAILGIELEEIEDWNCCGATSGHNTNKLLSLALPARNLAIAEKSGLDILAPCAACYNRFRTTEHAMRHDRKLKEKIEAIIEMPYDARQETVSIPDLLANKIGLEKIREKVVNSLAGMKAACYYGCLLVRPREHTGFDDTEEPQSMDQVIQALGAQAIDWPYKTECCGASLATSRPDVGTKMIYEVLLNAQAAGAECIVTACPLCMMNLDMRQKAAERAYKTKFNIPIYYITQLVAIACGDAPKTVGIDKHFVEAGKYLDTVKIRAAEAKAAAEKAAQEAAAKAKAKGAGAKEKAVKTGGAADEPDPKKVAGFVAALTKNPDKMAAKLVADPAQAGVLASILDDKRIGKLAHLMAKDMELAQKAAAAFVQQELKRQGECQD